MLFIKFLLALCFMGVVLQAEISNAANLSPTVFIDKHNEARAAVGVGLISWNATVAAYAQNYANRRTTDCALQHSQGPYGENIAIGYGDGFGPVEAFKLWVDEKTNYDYKSNSCVRDQCLHYTQIVWRDSVQLGCGMAQCKDGWTFITCNYYPRGNYLGQRPY